MPDFVRVLVRHCLLMQLSAGSKEGGGGIFSGGTWYLTIRVMGCDPFRKRGGDIYGEPGCLGVGIFREGRFRRVGHGSDH